MKERLVFFKTHHILERVLPPGKLKRKVVFFPREVNTCAIKLFWLMLRTSNVQYLYCSPFVDTANRCIVFI